MVHIFSADFRSNNFKQQENHLSDIYYYLT